jgi:hypothetical protein
VRKLPRVHVVPSLATLFQKLLGWIGWMGRGHVEFAYKKL